MTDNSQFISDTSQSDNWESVVAQSGTSVCYQCHRNGRLYFKKSLKTQFLSNNRYRSAFYKEFYMGSIIDCPYIVKYHKIIDNDNECSVYLDYVEGKNLNELLEEYPDYFQNRRILNRFTQQILDGLKYMHHRQIIHMDINPSNVMISAKSDDVKIIDLGFCYSDSFQDTPGTTQGFSASELRDGSMDFDVRTDIYAFGQILKFISEKTSLPHSYKTVMKKCLAEKKKDRYATVEDIINVLFQKATYTRYLLLAITVAVLGTIFFVYDCPRHIHRMMYGYEFTDNTGVAYNITSHDSMTCSVMGYRKGEDKRAEIDWGHVMVPERVTYNGKFYKVTTIADYAFRGDSTVSMMSLMPQKLIVGHSAFANTKNLKYVTFAGDDVTLLSSAFAYQNHEIKIDYPRNLKVIPHMCFYWTPLEHLDLPEGITSIEQDAFVNCDFLVDAILPSTLVSLGRGVFFACPKLEEVRIPAATESVGMFCFMECPKLKRIYNYATTPQHVTEIFDDDAHITIYVPRQSVELYRKAHGWNTQTILPMPDE